MPEDIVRFKDFSLSPEPVTFRIAPDDFECYSEIPLDTLLELAEISATGGDRKAQFERLKDFFDGIMAPEMAAQFRARCKPSTKAEPNPHPIGMRHVIDILPWLMEVYGLRPTQQSSDSPDGSDDTSTSSTESSSDEESMSSL